MWHLLQEDDRSRCSYAQMDIKNILSSGSAATFPGKLKKAGNVAAPFSKVVLLGFGVNVRTQGRGKRPQESQPFSSDESRNSHFRGIIPGADFAIILQLPGESVAIHPPNHKTVSESAQSMEVIFSVVL